MKKQTIENNNNIVIVLAVALGLILVVTGNSSNSNSHLGTVFAQTSGTTATTKNTAGTTTTPMDTFSANGDISSLIFQTQKPLHATINPSSLSAATKFILSGDWNLTVNKGKVTNFSAKFIKVLNDSTHWHTHDILNFKAASSNTTIMPIQLSPNKSASISGTVDVKLNNTNVWNGVKTNILISKGKIITINLDNNATANHFLGQPIYGVVLSIKDANGNELLKTQQKAMMMTVQRPQKMQMRM
jgi:hypothetical protein